MQNFSGVERMKKYLRKISDPKIIGFLGIGGLSLVGTLLVGGCSSEDSSKDSASIQDAAQRGATVTIEEQADGSYKILEEYPSPTTRVILRNADGSERILSQEEVDKIIAEEAKRVDEGTSQLTNPTGGGLSLGETILASAAGAILGSWIGSKLFNNQNYQAQQRTTYKSPQAYERSQNSFNKQGAANTGRSTTGRSGFYSPGNTGTSSTGTNNNRNTSSFGG